MALEISTPKMVVNRLILVGHRKEYHIPFSKGLNIIYGDSDTGKSSILNLIDYCLGAKEVDLYDEIETTGKYCLLELSLLDTLYTIKRNIFNPKEEVEVYPCTYDKIADFFPKYYSPNYSSEGKDGYFSEFLLSSMNIPIISVKQAPSKEESNFSIVSIRDILKFCFLNQDMVGHKKIFGDNYPRIIKLKETFKLMFNVLDVQISELTNLISARTKERDELNRKNKLVSDFLRETQVDSLSALETKRLNTFDQINVIDAQIIDIDNELVSNTAEFEELRSSIYALEADLEKNNREKIVKEQEMKQNIALKNDYVRDIAKTLAALEVLEKLPNVEDKATACPVCDQTMMISTLKNNFKETDKKLLSEELNGLRRRKSNLSNLIDKLRDEIDDNTLRSERFRKTLNIYKNDFDAQTKQIITPFINQRDILFTRRGNLSSEISNIQHFIKIRQQQSSIENDIISLESKLIRLRQDLKDLNENAPSLDTILQTLGQTLNAFLKFTGIKNVFGISISQSTFLPVIRNRDYEKITSGGVRTFSSVGFYLSILEYGITKSVNFPSFLMIDTIAKYIGKTKESYIKSTDQEEDFKEGMNDPDKYSNLYKYLLEFNSKYNNFQLIVVDNDIPSALENQLRPYIVKHFSTSGAGTNVQKGFIDDI